MPAGLIGPSLPAGAGLMWQAFLELHAARTWSDMGGPQPIALSEIDAWCRINRRQLSPADLTILRTLDGVYRAANADAPPSGDADDDWSKP